MVFRTYLNGWGISRNYVTFGATKEEAVEKAKKNFSAAVRSLTHTAYDGEDTEIEFVVQL